MFQLRAPLLSPLPGTLTEPEIHRRLVRAIGAIRDEDLAPLHAAAAAGRAAYAAVFLQTMAERPDLAALAPVVLYETIGPTLGAGNEAAALLWGAAHTCAMTYPDSVRRAGFSGEGPELGEALFEAILNSRSGVTFTVDEYEETWNRVETPDRRVNLAIPELLDELASLRDARDAVTADFPFVLSAGERRSSTANTIMRDPQFRKRDSIGLRMSAADAEQLGVGDGSRVRVTTKRGSAEVLVELSDTLQAGHVSLPNGLGLTYPDPVGDVATHGVPPNELTASEDRDWLAGTPWHKHVAARIERV
jgi:anaerobic selenocysteine-containing dehydrogenase